MILNQIYLIPRWDAKVLPLQVSVDLGVLALKVYFTLSRSLELVSQHPIQVSDIPKTFERVGSKILL